MFPARVSSSRPSCPTHPARSFFRGIFVLPFFARSSSILPWSRASPRRRGSGTSSSTPSSATEGATSKARTAMTPRRTLVTPEPPTMSSGASSGGARKSHRAAWKKRACSPSSFQELAV